MKRAILVHGWDGSPDREWFPWLKSELEERGFAVTAPLLPNAAHPHIDAWIPALVDAVGTPDSGTYFVGHSMGCQAIARYLATLPEGLRIGGVVYVGGYFDTLTLGEGEEIEIWDEWRDAPIDLGRVRARAPKSIAIFSDDDPFVPLDNSKRFAEELDSKIIVEHGQGHFCGDHYLTLASALEAVVSLAS